MTIDTTGGTSNAGARRRLRRTKNHRFRVFGDEGVVVLLERGEVVAVNAVGSRLLELWSEELPLERAVETIVREYEVEREEALRDVTDFADEMLSLGVLEEQGGP